MKCSGIELKESEGYIESPEYPKHYPPQAQCDWSIHAEKGYFIHLQFIDVSSFVLFSKVTEDK